MESPSRSELYQKTREDLLKRQLSNNENFDRSILTLSSAALALSVTFMRGSDTHSCFAVLVLAWIGFVVSIVVTIVSYLTSQQGIARQLDLAEGYYLQNNEDSLTARNHWAEWTDRFAYISATTFVFGIVCLLAYFSINLPASPKGQSMSTENRKPDTSKLVDNAASIPQLQKVDGGASIPRMQAAPKEDRGASIPPMQSAPPQTQSSTQGGGSGNADSKN